MTQDTRPPVGSTGTLAELQVGPGDVVRAQDVFDLWNNSLYTIHETHPSGYCSELCAVRNGGSGYRRVAVSDTEFRLISRAAPDRPAHIVTHDGREYDLTKLETPFGLLMESAPPVAEALKAWPHGLEYWVGGDNWRETENTNGYNLVHRAKPAPAETRVRCARMEIGGLRASENGTCIKLPDGSLDWASWEPDA